MRERCRLVCRDGKEQYNCAASGGCFCTQRQHFNAVTFGNELKPDCLFGYHDGSRTNPGTETISFTFADGTTDDSFVVPKLDYSRAERMLNRIMELNEVDPDHQIKVRGHVLVWHSQTPGMVHCNGPAAFYRKKQQI